jgi:hypothetical protein
LNLHFIERGGLRAKPNRRRTRNRHSNAPFSCACTRERLRTVQPPISVTRFPVLSEMIENERIPKVLAIFLQGLPVSV